MVTHGLDRKFAFRILSLPGVSNTTYGVIISLGVIAALISSVIFDEERRKLGSFSRGEINTLSSSS